LLREDSGKPTGWRNPTVGAVDEIKFLLRQTHESAEIDVFRRATQSNADAPPTNDLDDPFMPEQLHDFHQMTVRNFSYARAISAIDDNPHHVRRDESQHVLRSQ
jgi:hypothetical protein